MPLAGYGLLMTIEIRKKGATVVQWQSQLAGISVNPVLLFDNYVV
jgi:hypothetical protein